MIATVNRHGLTDDQWLAIEPLMPQPNRMGRPPRDAREMMDALMCMLRTGAPWRDLPDWFGPWQTAYTRFCRWRNSGLLDRIVVQLQVMLADSGKIDWELWCVDGTSVRAARCAAGAQGGARKSLQTTR